MSELNIDTPLAAVVFRTTAALFWQPSSERGSRDGGLRRSWRSRDRRCADSGYITADPQGAVQTTVTNHPPPADWPKGIRPISLEGTSLFGLDPKGRLYWDGEEIVVTRKLELTPWQQRLAGAVAVVAILVGLTQLADYFGFKEASDLWTFAKSLTQPR